MAASRPGPSVAPGYPLALAVADAGWFTTENLFREVDPDRAATLLLKCMDVRVALQQRRSPWEWVSRLQVMGRGLWQRSLVLPSGWMKTFPRLGMRPIARAVRQWRARCVGDAPLALVMTYPHYLYLRDLLRPDLLLYYNLDDYTLYWPRQARVVRALEHRAVREADVTVCVSRVRAEALRNAVPDVAERVRYLPHGAPTPSLAQEAWHRPAPPPADLAGLPRPLLGFVGSLEDRVDWPLLSRLSATFPGGSVVLVGRPPEGTGEPWQERCAACLARPNVHAIGWRPQETIAAYNRSFDVSLIPYRTDHPFNRVCCPTKIMDCMAATRPVVSTALPECQLHADLFHVAVDEGAFMEAVRAIVGAGSDDGLAAQRLEHARAHTCRVVVAQMLDWLNA